MKVSGKVFAYLSPKRQFFTFYTYNEEGKLTGYKVSDEKDLEEVKGKVRNIFEQKRKEKADS